MLRHLKITTLFKRLRRFRYKTLNLPLSTGCCILLFKAYLFTSKRKLQAANADSEKETYINKLTWILALPLKNFKVVKVALQIQSSNFGFDFSLASSSGQIIFTLLVFIYFSRTMTLPFLTEIKSQFCTATKPNNKIMIHVFYSWAKQKVKSACKALIIQKLVGNFLVFLSSPPVDNNFAFKHFLLSCIAHTFTLRIQALNRAHEILSEKLIKLSCKL